jgi:hypothetical protein
MSFGAELVLTIPVLEGGVAKASEIMVGEIHPGPNW